jgi:hypothetical protein
MKGFVPAGPGLPPTGPCGALELSRSCPGWAWPGARQGPRRSRAAREQRLDPLTKQRIQRLGVGTGARCLEIGGGRGSITRWLSDVAGPAGRVIATDVQTGFLSEIDASNVEVIRHDIRTGTFPPGSFDLIHTRAVLTQSHCDNAIVRLLTRGPRLKEPDTEDTGVLSPF